MRVFLLTIVSVLVVSCATNPGSPEQSGPISFQPGQEWKYKNRAGEDDSRLVILKLEKGEDGTRLAHISVSNLKTEGMTTAQHLPFTEKAVRASVVELCGTVEFEAEPEGYRHWKAAYEAHEAGVFDSPVAETLEVMTQQVEVREE